MKHFYQRHSGRTPVVIIVLLLLLGASLVLSTAAAQEPLPAGDGSRAVLGDDGGAYEVGAHSAVGGSLTKHGWAEASGLYNKLKSCGWNGRYIYNRYWAWEEDFKRSAAGGKEYRYLDTVDLQFYVGHGSPNGYFTFYNTSHDDRYLTTNDCYRAWGNNDNDWVALTSCQVLSNSKLGAWANCMRGTHLILGFKTNATARYPYYATQGYRFAYYLCRGYTVPQAWYKAADRTQPQGTVVRTLINELSCLNDKPKTGKVCGDSWDWDAWVQTHRVGSELPGAIDVEALAGQMPIFRTPPLTLGEAQTQYGSLGDIFQVTPSLRLDRQEDPIWTDMAGSRELEMDSVGGLYGYMDLDQTWTYTATAAALAAPRAAITAGQAISIAQQFLQDNDLMPPDARFFEVVSDTISGGVVLSGTAEARQEDLLDNEQVQMWQVLYSRVLTYTPPARNGEEVEFLVVGPGARQKVYVATEGATSRATGALADIVGAIGGWRPVETATRAGSRGVAQTIDILTPEQIEALHGSLYNEVGLNPPPLEADGSQIMSYTLAYWEEGLGVTQSQLTPVYALYVSYTQGITELGTAWAYIPASPLYMRPLARIEGAPAGKVQMGATIHLTATEASTTLADLGYDAILDFNLGGGLPEDYLYTWYVDSLDDANLIGTGRTLSYVLEAQIVARNGDVYRNIILQVQDINNPDSPTSMDLHRVEIYPRIYLPTVVRDSS